VVMADADHLDTQEMAVARPLCLRPDRGGDVLRNAAGAVDDEMRRGAVILESLLQAVGGAAAGRDVDGQSARRAHLRREVIVADPGFQRYRRHERFADETPLVGISAGQQRLVLGAQPGAGAAEVDLQYARERARAGEAPDAARCRQPLEAPDLGRLAVL